MSTEPLEQAIAATREVLAGVSADQLDADTPCAQWKVRELVNHIVGGQYFFEAGLKGEAPGGEAPAFADGDFVAAFDDGAQRCVQAFQADGVLDQTISMPFGDMPGRAVLGLAVTDTLTHGWDLAKATGQDTDVAPALSAQVLEQAKESISPAFRSEDGAVFGFEQEAPADASNADRLAAFLGRTV